MIVQFEFTEAKLRATVEGLHPYARHMLRESARIAHLMHAKQVDAAHVLCTLMNDEDSAAHRATLHAFADPGSIAVEALATADGILVVGSAGSAPFSPRCVAALMQARDAAEGAGEETSPGHLLVATLAVLEAAGREALLAAGLEVDEAPSTGSREWTPDIAPLFKGFSMEAKRCLSAAARDSRRAGEATISPARLFIASLAADSAYGMSRSRAEHLLAGATVDSTLPTARAMAPDGILARLLGELEPGADSLGLLGILQRGETQELALLLTRNKITGALLERCQGVFEDPDPPASCGG